LNEVIIFDLENESGEAVLEMYDTSLSWRSVGVFL